MGEPDVAPDRERLRRCLATAALALSLLLWAAFCAHVLAGYPHTQWDFSNLYYGPKAYFQGLDPYRLETLSAVSGQREHMGYTQSPTCAYLLMPFTLFSYRAAWYLWFFAKLMLLGLLALVWRRSSYPGSLLAYSLTLLLAFNAAACMDLVAGNKAIVEQLLLWSGLHCYLRSRWWAFCVLVVAASTFNLLPLAFLALLLAAPIPWPQRLKLLAFGALLFACAVGLPFASHPALLPSYAHALTATREPASVNPCVLGLLDTLAQRAPRGGLLGMAASFCQVHALHLYGLYALLILAVSFRPLLAAARGGERPALVMAAALTYALAAPRLKPYTYILLVPPALTLFGKLHRRPLHRVLAMLLLFLPTPGGPIPGILSTWGQPWAVRPAVDYFALYQVLTALALWAVLVPGRPWLERFAAAPEPGAEQQAA